MSMQKHETGRPQRKHSQVLRHWLALPGRRIADIGCGRGPLLPILAHGGAFALGIDPQPGLLVKSRETASGEPDGATAWVAARGEALPLAEGCLDGAIYFNALHHVPVDAQDAALDAVRRALRPGGRLVVIEPLAEGPTFEIMRPVEDETAVRAAAQGALERAAEGSLWRLVRREDYTATVRHSSVEAFLDGLAAVDPARRGTLDRLSDSIRRAFLDRASPSEGGGYLLEQPYRLHVLDRTDP